MFQQVAFSWAGSGIFFSLKHWQNGWSVQISVSSPDTCKCSYSDAENHFRGCLRIRQRHKMEIFHSASCFLLEHTEGVLGEKKRCRGTRRLHNGVPFPRCAEVACVFCEFLLQVKMPPAVSGNGSCLICKKFPFPRGCFCTDCLSPFGLL